MHPICRLARATGRFASRCLPFAVVGAIAVPPGTVAAANARPPLIRWGDCDPALVGGAYPDLGYRLHCGRAHMPLDHLKPDGRTIEVGIVRIAAADSMQREGAIFVNVGGPGGQPAAYVAALASYFDSVDPTDPVHGDKRRLAERFDFIAVIPRGLKGGWTYDCDPPPLTHQFLPAHRDDANWAKVLSDTRARANACSRPVEAPYLSTEQHVRDMDAVRASLGDPLIHFYGISYGGRVGATYAAFFPHRLGRMLLDSTLAFPGSYRNGMYLTSDAERAVFERDVLGPVQHEARRFGQPEGDGALAWAVRNLSDVVRPAWHDAMLDPVYLAAVLTMDRWVKTGGWHGWDALARKVSTQRFSPDPDGDVAIRAVAEELVEHGQRVTTEAGWRTRRGMRTQESLIDQHGEWLNLAVMCNDETWEPIEQKIRARADRDAFDYPLLDGTQIVDQLTCSAWPRRVARSPDFDLLTTRAPFLLLQSEDDVATPLAGARTVLKRFPTSRLIVARGVGRHGLLGRSSTPCIEQGAIAYLLRGELPAGTQRESSCPFVPFHEGDPRDAYAPEGQ
ncbi:alpha/beta hydrolase [Bacillus sp. NP157]|nr:alpha/beta hydrolase [Bacillus sp. NP157]